MTACGLYIHIPFCVSRCGYCDFSTTTKGHADVDSYIACLKAEIKSHPSHPVDTIYFGGGTPTILTADQMGDIMGSVNAQFDTSGLSEATFEANPESSSFEKLKAFRDHGFNRISFGLQSTHPQHLAFLDRAHTKEQFISAFRQAREVGYKNISVDLIYGLPHQTLNEWEETIKEVVGLGPEHISAYALKIEPGTPLAQKGLTIDDDLEADMYLMACERIRQAGYRHYEISNFSRPGFECRHNLKYWRNHETVGFGLSAASYGHGVRSVTTASWEDYMRSAVEGESIPKEVVRLTPQDRLKEEIMLGLRLAEGVPARRLEEMAVPNLALFLERGFAEKKDDRFFLKETGWLLSNQIFQYLV